MIENLDNGVVVEPPEAIKLLLLAAAVKDAKEYWSDENWPYGPNLVSFAQKHAEAIKIAESIFK